MLGAWDPIPQLGISVWLLAVIVLWEVVWKALAMWRAARKNHMFWFVFFLIVNLLGIPEIIYLIVTNKKSANSRKRR